MINEVDLGNRRIEYCLEYKRVKNINLRIRPDGTVYVSANKRVSKNTVEEFIKSKEGFILNALAFFEEKSKQMPKQYFSEEEISNVILDICRKEYPYFEKRGIDYPKIKFRKMVSRWGSCNSLKGILTFNKNLMYAPLECIEYVVLHEFTHFLEANHSDKFYKELEKVCPLWRQHRKRLKNIYIK